MRVVPLPSDTHTASQPTVAIETHGCKLNQADSSVLTWGFVEAGFRVVPVGENADVQVLNSCTVTHVADRKARQALRALRRRNPDATIVATGCYAQRTPQELEDMEEMTDGDDTPESCKTLEEKCPTQSTTNNSTKRVREFPDIL